MTVIKGGASVQLHMLNEESRKYFNRAYAISGSAFGYYILHRNDNIKHIQNCSEVNGTGEMIEYLKTTSSSILADCYAFTECLEGDRNEISVCHIAGGGNVWMPIIESPSTIGAFLSRTPEDIYKSDKAPVMDTWFGFASHVYRFFALNIISPKLYNQLN